MAIPVGAAVRETPSGPLGRKVKIRTDQARRGYAAVRFDGEAAWRHVPVASLTYVARRYDTAKAWEADKAGGLS